MEGDSKNGFDMEQYKNNLDDSISGVMPDSWKGHARLCIRESEAVPDSIESKAIDKANKIADKKGVSPERAANALISKIAEKRD